MQSLLWLCGCAIMRPSYHFMLFFHQFFCLNIFKILYPWILTHNVLYVLLLLLQTRCSYLLMNQTANWMPQLPGADLKGEGLHPLFILYFIKFSFSLKRMGIVLWCNFSGPLYLNLLGTPMTSTYKTWFVQFVMTLKRLPIHLKQVYMPIPDQKFQPLPSEDCEIRP